jgi:transcriptional regulator with XRE-family HTH domain
MTPQPRRSAVAPVPALPTSDEGKAIRLAAGLDQAALARLAGVPRTAVVGYERGETPTGSVRVALARAIARLAGGC